MDLFDPNLPMTRQRQKFFATVSFIAGFFIVASYAEAQLVCKNPVKTPYNSNPAFCSPDGSRAFGVQITIGSKLSDVQDLRCQCLPIALRYNNLGVLKTKKAGFWPGQFAMDGLRHAVFRTVEDGVVAWGIWMKDRNNLSSFEIMSIYAPPSDCVGSIGTPPNCPNGVNPTKQYATEIAAALGKDMNDKLNLNGSDCAIGRKNLAAAFTVIATFEISREFCGGQNCSIDREMFERAMRRVWGNSCG